MFSSIANSCYSFFCCRKKRKDNDQFILENDDSPRIPYKFDEKAKMDIEKFLYPELYDKMGAVYSARFRDGYIFLEKNSRNTGDRKNFIGWKIHISLAHNEKNIEKAWNAVMPLLIQDGVYIFKVAQVDRLKTTQPGKGIVIYEYSSRPDLDWNRLLNEMEKELIKDDIKVGEAPKFRFDKEYTDIPETKISNSKYFYCANDEKNSEVRYDNKDSPFKNVVLLENKKSESFIQKL